MRVIKQATRYTLRISALAIIGSPALSVQALAQAAEPFEDGGKSQTDDNAIVVTAQRRAQSLQDVPVAVSVTTGQALAEANIVGLQDLSQRTPSVRISPSPLSDFIAIRGVGSSLNLGFEQSVGTFVDGFYRGRSRSTRAALFDIERVEVLKGPQTTFFGNNAIAGAFNITTRKPTHEFEANGFAYYAPAFGEYTAEVGVTLPIAESLSVRAVGKASGMTGYIKNSYLERKEPDLDDLMGRFSVLFDPSPNFTINTRVDVGRTRNRGIFSTQVLNCPPDPNLFPDGAVGNCARYLAASGGTVEDTLNNVSASNDSAYDMNFVELANTATIGLGDNQLIFSTSYYHHDYYLFNDVGAVPATLGGSAIGTTQTIPVVIYENFNQFTQEVRLESDRGGPFEYMIGAYYGRGSLDLESFQGVFFAPFGAIFNGALGSSAYSPANRIASHIVSGEIAKTMSFFASSTYDLADPLRLNLGVRYTRVHKTAKDRLAEVVIVGSDIPDRDNFTPGPDYSQATALGILGVTGGLYPASSRTDDKFMPSVSLQYDLAPDVMVYASYTKGFKAGGFSGFNSSSVFGPEQVDAYEVGLDLPPSEWPNFYFRIGHEGGMEWRGSTSRKISSGSCARRRSCWRRAARLQMRAGGSALPSRVTTAGARSTAA